MSDHHAAITWRRETPDFVYDTYDRTHALALPGGQSLVGSAAPDYKGDPAKANPEELFAASLAGCHMLTFLAICARSRLVVDSYEDDAVATLGKRADGKLCVTRVTLRPRVTWGGTPPTAERVRSLHEKAHEACFIALAVSCEVVVTAP